MTPDILAVDDMVLAQRLVDHRTAMAEKILDQNRDLQLEGI